MPLPSLKESANVIELLGSSADTPLAASLRQFDSAFTACGRLRALCLVLLTLQVVFNCETLTTLMQAVSALKVSLLLHQTYMSIHVGGPGAASVRPPVSTIPAQPRQDARLAPAF